MSLDEEVARIARRQHGLVTRAQVLEAGFRPHHLQSRLDSGRWELLHRSVYRVAGTPSTREQRLLAACFAAGPGAVASHRAASELWALDGVEPSWTEISVQQGHLPRVDGVLVHRTRDLLPQHVTERRGVPSTNPMRSILDLGAVSPRWVVERAMDDALGRKLLSITGLVRVWRDCGRPGRNGSGVLRSLLEEHLPNPAASVLEKKMLRLHRRFGLPEPEVEYRVYDESGRFVGRVDFCHPAHRVVIEVDGYETRTSVDRFVSDRARDRRLKALGWTVLRFTWLEVVYLPLEVAAELGDFLGVSVSR